MSRKSTDPTMKDVAVEAGVALGTVSRVVNGLPVGREYQKRVEQAIEKLGYRVNSYAQGMKSGKTNTVALLIPNTLNPYFGQLTYHINRTLAQRNCRMLLCSTDADQEAEQAYMDMVQQNRVDGIISLTYNERLNLREDTPIVTIDRVLSPQVPCITSDNFGGGQLAGRTLIGLGCKRLAYLGTGSPLTNEVSKRGDGFKSACDALGVSCESMIIHDGTPYSVFQSFLMEHMTAEGFTLDGIFCVTDHLAQRVIRFLRRMGVDVPGQVQVIGFDGLRDYSTGDLLCSTIVQNVERIAQKSVELVLDPAWGENPSLVCLPVEYANGGTTREEL